MLAAHDNATVHDQEAEAHRQAYNAAFEELGLNWHWDPITFACLASPDRYGLRAYLEKEHAHLLRAYDADFLVDAIEAAKRRCHHVMTRNQAGRASYGSRSGDAGTHPPA